MRKSSFCCRFPCQTMNQIFSNDHNIQHQIFIQTFVKPNEKTTVNVEHVLNSRLTRSKKTGVQTHVLLLLQVSRKAKKEVCLHGQLMACWISMITNTSQQTMAQSLSPDKNNLDIYLRLTLVRKNSAKFTYEMANR